MEALDGKAAHLSWTFHHVLFSRLLNFKSGMSCSSKSIPLSSLTQLPMHLLEQQSLRVKLIRQQKSLGENCQGLEALDL